MESTLATMRFISENASMDFLPPEFKYGVASRAREAFSIGSTQSANSVNCRIASTLLYATRIIMHRLALKNVQLTRVIDKYTRANSYNTYVR